MLDLAGEQTAGTHSYFVPVEHTRCARQRLGPDKLVAPELACVIDSDPVRAKAVARDFAELYLGLRNYTNNLLDFGFTEQASPTADQTGSSTRSSLRAAPSRSPRSCARTSTRAPITSAYSHWARRAFRASRGPRSRTS